MDLMTAAGPFRRLGRRRGHRQKPGCMRSRQTYRSTEQSPPPATTCRAPSLGDGQRLKADRIACLVTLKVWPKAASFTTACLKRSTNRRLGASWRPARSQRHGPFQRSRQACSLMNAGEATNGGAPVTFLRRKFLLAVTLATTAATLSLGQTPAPVGGTRAGQSANSVPDFSGLWTHAALGFESPVSGPGPVRNLGRTPSGQSNFNQLVGDPTSPILQPWAAEVVKKLGAISLAGKAFPDPDNQCLLNPV